MTAFRRVYLLSLLSLPLLAKKKKSAPTKGCTFSLSHSHDADMISFFPYSQKKKIPHFHAADMSLFLFLTPMNRTRCQSERGRKEGRTDELELALLSISIPDSEVFE